jgi:hypothetical protein
MRRSSAGEWLTWCVRDGRCARPPPLSVSARRPSIAGWLSAERAELAAARRRIRELESELEITKQAAALFAETDVRPKGSTR